MASINYDDIFGIPISDTGISFENNQCTTLTNTTNTYTLIVRQLIVVPLTVQQSIVRRLIVQRYNAIVNVTIHIVIARERV